MKTLNTMILALGTLLGSAGAYAETKAVANIPFDFTVADKAMPAGEYTLESASPARNLLRIINDATGQSVVVMAMDTTWQPRKDTPAGLGKVTFHRCEDRYFLSYVWTTTGLQARTLPSKVEREIQAKGGETQMASLDVPVTGTR